MYAPLFKHEAGWFGAVNPGVAVIGEGSGAETVVQALAAHPVYWVGENAWAMAESVSAHPRERVLSVQGQRGHFRLQLQGVQGLEYLEVGGIVLSPSPVREIIPEFLGLPLSRLVYPANHAQRIPAMGQQVAFYLGEEESGGFFTIAALREAIRFAEMGSKVYFFFYDLPVAADGFEVLSDRARQLGILFLRLASPLEVVDEGELLRLSFHDAMLPQFEALDIKVEMLFLGERFRPSSELFRLAQLMDIQTDSEGFLQANNVHHLPIYTNRPGIYVAGAAKGSAYSLQVSLEAQAIAGELAPFLTGEILVRDGFARVNPEMCSLCLNCCRICNRRAVEIDRQQKAVYIYPLACQACGICAAECPSRAITLSHTVHGLSRNSRKTIRIYACENSGYLALHSFRHPAAWKDELEIISVPCTGHVETLSMLQDLVGGVRQIIVVGCREGSCLCGGNRHAESRVLEIKEKLLAIGRNPERIEWIAAAPNAPLEFQDTLKKVLDRYRTGLGRGR